MFDYPSKGPGQDVERFSVAVKRLGPVVLVPPGSTGSRMPSSSFWHMLRRERDAGLLGQFQT